MQLSSNKQGLLSRLLSHRDLVNALDNLLPFPGLWKDFHLGSIHQDFAVCCDEEMICYLRHLHTRRSRHSRGSRRPDCRKSTPTSPFCEHHRPPLYQSTNGSSIKPKQTLPRSRGQGEEKLDQASALGSRRSHSNDQGLPRELHLSSHRSEHCPQPPPR